MRFLIATLTLVFSLAAWGQQQTIAYWALNDAALVPGTTNQFAWQPSDFPLDADAGLGVLSLENIRTELDANGFYDSIRSFVGSSANLQSGFPSGGSLSIQGGIGLANNGASILLLVDTSGFDNLELSWAWQSTASGFNNRTLAWSVDGESFTTFATSTTSGAIGFRREAYDLSAITELNDQPKLWIRATLQGATNATGNNRFDNILIAGSPIAAASRFTAFGEDFGSDPFARGWQDQNLVGNQTWRWVSNFSNVEFNGFVSGQGCLANDNWLISPPIELNELSAAELSFELSRNFSGGPLQVLFSTDYAGSGTPLDASWDLLDTIGIDRLPQTNTSFPFGPYGGFDGLSTLGHLAFRYDSTAPGSGCAAWRVVAVELSAEGSDDGVPFACGNEVLRIHEIQGSGFASPIQGQPVQIEAIVVGAFQSTANGGLGGFFLQEADVNQDDDPLTSEGIFVFDNDFGLSVDPGDVVRVAGTVTELFGETQIAAVTDVAVCDTGRLADTSPALLELPAAELIEFEAVEGMWVRTVQDLIVTDVFNAVQFGEFQVSNGRLFQPTQVVAPGADAVALQAANDLNRLLIDDARNGANRQPFINGLDGVSELATDNPIRNGFTFEAGFEGVMSFAFSRYRLHPLTQPGFRADSNPRTGFPNISDAGNLRIATFNVENLFTTFNVPGSQCGPNQLSCRGASTESELERQFGKLVPAILAMEADLFALTEIENDADDSTLERLVAELNGVDPVGDWSFIRTGVLGTDAIKPAFIYRATRLQPEGDFAVLDRFVDPRFDDTRQRPALAQTFRAWNSGKFTAVALHLRAKGSCPSGNPAGNPNADQGDGQSCWNLWRSLSAEALADWLETDPTGSGDPDFVILGDFNAYAQEDPMLILEEAGYVNLGILANNGDPAIYSFSFFGQAGSLDHALASPSLLEQVLDARHWAINSDEPRAFSYNEGTLPGAGAVQKPESFYQADPFRSADHDPLIIELDLTPCAPGIVNRPQHPRGKILPLPRC